LGMHTPEGPTLGAGCLPGGQGRAAKAGMAIATIIAAITNATVTTKSKRLMISATPPFLHGRPLWFAPLPRTVGSPDLLVMCGVGSHRSS